MQMKRTTCRTGVTCSDQPVCSEEAFLAGWDTPGSDRLLQGLLGAGVVPAVRPEHEAAPAHLLEDRAVAGLHHAAANLASLARQYRELAGPGPVARRRRAFRDGGRADPDPPGRSRNSGKMSVAWCSFRGG